MISDFCSFLGTWLALHFFLGWIWMERAFDDLCVL